MMQRDAIKPSRAGRNRGWRRRERHIKMMRRLKDDRNTHYNDLDCPCRVDPRARARFADYPAVCSGICCGNPRRSQGGKKALTVQERRALGLKRRNGSLDSD
jgi:hypothetical protein